MVLRTEDNARFSGEIVEDDAEIWDAEIWAAYSIEAEVKGSPVAQSDRRSFASKHQARLWLIGEADKRGFPDFLPKVLTASALMQGDVEIETQNGENAMSEKRSNDMDGNQGEGNRAAAEHYNDGVKKFVQEGKVKPAADAARKAVDGAERKELERAEQEGKSHAKS